MAAVETVYGAAPAKVHALACEYRVLTSGERPDAGADWGHRGIGSRPGYWPGASIPSVATLRVSPRGAGGGLRPL